MAESQLAQRNYVTVTLFVHFLVPTARSIFLDSIFYNLTSSFLWPTSMKVLHFPLHNPCIFFTQSFSTFLKTCPYHLNWCCYITI